MHLVQAFTLLPEGSASHCKLGCNLTMVDCIERERLTAFLYPLLQIVQTLLGLVMSKIINFNLTLIY